MSNQQKTAQHALFTKIETTCTRSSKASRPNSDMKSGRFERPGYAEKKSPKSRPRYNCKSRNTSKTMQEIKVRVFTCIKKTAILLPERPKYRGVLVASRILRSLPRYSWRRGVMPRDAWDPQRGQAGPFRQQETTHCLKNGNVPYQSNKSKCNAKVTKNIPSSAFVEPYQATEFISLPIIHIKTALRIRRKN